MATKKSKDLIPVIESKIYIIRDLKVMLDRDLAELYGVPTKRLNEQVKRNSDRFSEDFMFQLNKDEFAILKSQIATSSWGGIRKLPYAFTENGVAMLSSVLNSKKAIAVNISIMRTFTKLREMIISEKDLSAIKRQITFIEKRLDEHDESFAIIFDELFKPPSKKIKRIGFE
jgi:hypothetical protein